MNKAHHHQAIIVGVIDPCQSKQDLHATLRLALVYVDMSRRWREEEGYVTNSGRNTFQTFCSGDYNIVLVSTGSRHDWTSKLKRMNESLCRSFD
jgi:hypothetical protein